MMIRALAFIAVVAAAVPSVATAQAAVAAAAPVVAPAVPPVAPPAAAAQEEASGFGVTKTGWGAAAVADLFSARFNGEVGAFSAGFGFGLSYKWESKGKRYPFELGFFLAPRFTVPSESSHTSSSGTVAVLTHVNMLGGFGVGFGYDFFRGGTGTVAPAKDTLFFTLGYGITNSRS